MNLLFLCSTGLSDTRKYPPIPAIALTFTYLGDPEFLGFLVGVLPRRQLSPVADLPHSGAQLMADGFSRRGPALSLEDGEKLRVVARTLQDLRRPEPRGRRHVLQAGEQLIQLVALLVLGAHALLRFHGIG